MGSNSLVGIVIAMLIIGGPFALIVRNFNRMSPEDQREFLKGLIDGNSTLF